MIIWGWGGSRPKDLGPAVPLKCPNCNNDTIFHFVTTASWFRLFFVPLVPYNRKQLLLCPICTRGLTLNKQQADIARQLAAMVPLPPTTDSGGFRSSSAELQSAYGAKLEALTDLFKPIEVTASDVEGHHPKKAGWYQDPYRRHQVRYWDMTRWTEHVADRGIQGVDEPPALP